jgi:hypothetical protein
VRNVLKINPCVIRSFGRLGAEIKKKENLLVQLETAVRGILKKDTKNTALPLLTNYLQYCSSFSVKHNSDNPSWKPDGMNPALFATHSESDI